MHKAVSSFGKLLIWQCPGINKARVLVKVHLKDVALVPHGLVVTSIHG